MWRQVQNFLACTSHCLDFLYAGYVFTYIRVYERRGWLGKRDPNPYWFNIRDFRRYCVKHLENTASILCGVFLIPTKISYVKLLAPGDEMFFARFQCGRMQAGWRLSNPTSWKVAKTSIARQCVFESRLPMIHILKHKHCNYAQKTGCCHSHYYYHNNSMHYKSTITAPARRLL